MSAENDHSINFAKSTEDEPYVLPDDTVDLNGDPVEDPYLGRVVEVDGGHYSLAAYDAVAPPADEANPPEAADTPAIEVLGRRIGKMYIRTEEHAPEVDLEPTGGSELEFRATDEEGNPVDSGMYNELFRSQAELGTPVAQNNGEIRVFTRDLTRRAAAYAADRAMLAVPVSVYNPEPTEEDVNPKPYIRSTNEHMVARTGFEPHQAARYGSVQFHTGTGRTEDMLAAITAKQLLDPILTAPSMSGPFIHGGLAEKLATIDWSRLTSLQQAHLAHVGLTQAAFQGPVESYRPLMRGVASPGPNIHNTPAPDSIEEYLKFVDRHLREGNINTADRAFGVHRDRPRVILDGSGANTIESVNNDTFLAHDVVMGEMHILQNAVIARLEAMNRSGDDPFAFLVDKLGINATDKTDALRQSNTAYLYQTARAGNSANIYGRQPGEWADDLLRWTELDKDMRTAEVVGKAFSNNRVATAGLMRWATERGKTDSGFRAAEAHYATGLGSPSVAMRLERRLMRQDPAFTRHYPASLTKEQERRIGEDFTAFGQRD